MAVEKFGASEHFACALLGQNRSAFRKKKPDMGYDEMQLRTQLRTVAGQHPRLRLAESALASAGPA